MKTCNVNTFVFLPETQLVLPMHCGPKFLYSQILKGYRQKRQTGSEECFSDTFHLLSDLSWISSWMYAKILFLSLIHHDAAIVKDSAEVMLSRMVPGFDWEESETDFVWGIFVIMGNQAGLELDEIKEFEHGDKDRRKKRRQNQTKRDKKTIPKNIAATIQNIFLWEKPGPHFAQWKSSVQDRKFAHESFSRIRE